MERSNSHNLQSRPDDQDMRYGIRVSLADSDPFQRLLPDRWETLHWYRDGATRDVALRDMASRHRYSRMGDAPAVRYEPVER